MSESMMEIETPRQTALQIGQALAYLMREAAAAGLPDLATQIESAEATAYESARHQMYFNA